MTLSPVECMADGGWRMAGPPGPRGHEGCQVQPACFPPPPHCTIQLHQPRRLEEDLGFSGKCPQTLLLIRMVWSKPRRPGSTPGLRNRSLWGRVLGISILYSLPVILMSRWAAPHGCEERRTEHASGAQIPGH